MGTRTLGSNPFNSTSFLTEHPNISPAQTYQKIIQAWYCYTRFNNHIRFKWTRYHLTPGTVNLDTRYYTETESDTLFTKLGQGIISELNI